MKWLNKQDLLDTIAVLEYENRKLQEQIENNDYLIEQYKQEINKMVRSC